MQERRVPPHVKCAASMFDVPCGAWSRTPSYSSGWPVCLCSVSQRQCCIHLPMHRISLTQSCLHPMWYLRRTFNCSLMAHTCSKSIQYFLKFPQGYQMFPITTEDLLQQCRVSVFLLLELWTWVAVQSNYLLLAQKNKICLQCSNEESIPMCTYVPPFPSVRCGELQRHL